MLRKKGIFKGFKIIFRYLARYKKDLVVLAILGIFSAILNGIVPYISGRLFDAILKPAKIFSGTKIEIPLFLFILIIWGLIQLLGNIINWRNGLKSDRMGNIIYADYITNAFGVLLELPLSFHKNHKMGGIADKLDRAANHMTNIISNVIIEILPQFLSLIVALIITFYVKALLASFLLIGILAYIAILFRILIPVAELQRKGHKAYNDAFSNSYDAVFNILAIKQTVAETYEKRNIFRSFRLKAVGIWNKVTAIWQSINFYQRFVIIFTQLAIFIFSIFYIHQGTMTIGELVMFNGYAGMLFGPFVRLGYNWQSIQNGVVAIERAEKILNQPKENYSPAKAPILSDIKGQIVFENVFFKYQKKHGNILDGLSFRAEPGEVVALVGESGVGKTTIIDLISGYYFPQKGKVLIDGHNVKNLDLKFLRSKIAVVPQEVVLFNDTIKKNIAYGKFSASDRKIKEAAEKSYASEFIESFPRKYKQVVGERGIKLSVGQKQRVAIARAILRNPKILILDEPTSALDAKSEKFIQESLEELMKGRTTFIIAHRLSTVRKADKILVVQEGKIIEQGRHEKLIQIPNGAYRQFYELQIGLM